MAKKQNQDVPDYGFLESDDIRVGVISGQTFTNKRVEYAVVDGMAIFEGCIALGTVEEMEQRMAALNADPSVSHGVVISGDQYRWPNSVIPYDVDPALTNKQRVTDAIKHIEQKTGCLRFVVRTASNAAQYPNYVHVKPSSGCWSFVGMRGGKQDLGLAGGCSTGNTIHEFLHAAGMWHEQSREDRNSFVKVNFENITAGREHNFNQHITDGDDVGPYDYGSIMHYPAKAFSKNGQPTIEPLQSGVTIGQRTSMSDGDVKTIQSIYRCWHHNKKLIRVYTSHHAQNAWAYISGYGWRKVEVRTTDGVTNTFALLCAARGNNKNVSLYMDGTTIYRARMCA